MAIPRIIHYCWFGGSNLPDDALVCINSWEKYCPDFEIRRWDESNYNYKQYEFTRCAYEAKEWAFVSDVARLDIIYNYGGFYLDTDVELVKSLEPFVREKAYMGFERGRKVATGLGFGAEKGSKVIRENLEKYKHLSFYDSKGRANLIPCPQITTDYLESIGLERKDKFQSLGDLNIYPSSFFCPMLLEDGKAELCKDTVSIHHYAASWTTDKEKREAKRRTIIYTKYGAKGLRVFDGMMLMKKSGLRAFMKRLGEIVDESIAR